MDNDELVNAVHKLEVNVLERIGEQTTVIEVGNERLETLRISVDRHGDILYGNPEGEQPGLLEDMHQLKKTEKERRMTLRGVALAFMTMVGKFCYDFWNA